MSENEPPAKMARIIRTKKNATTISRQKRTLQSSSNGWEESDQTHTTNDSDDSNDSNASNFSAERASMSLNTTTDVNAPSTSTLKDTNLWKWKSDATNAILNCYTLCDTCADTDTGAGTSTSGDKNAKAICLFCTSAGKSVQSATKSFPIGNVSNLRTHLERSHKSDYQKIINDCKEEAEAKRNELNADFHSKVKDAMLNFIVKERLPLSKLESLPFNELINLCLKRKPKVDEKDKPIPLLNRFSGRRRIVTISKQLRQQLKDSFKTVEYFAATSDIWTRSNRSFIAVTAHYINPETLEIESKYLACQHFPGRHTHDKVVEKLNGIFSEYGILQKVFFVTTDKAGEYVAAFRYFGDNYRSIELLTVPSVSEDEFALHEYGQNVSNVERPPIDEPNLEEEEEEYDVNDFVFNDLSENGQNANGNGSDDDRFHLHDVLLQNEDNDQIDGLPNSNNVNCSSHLLEKVGRIDSKNAETDATYKAMYDEVFSKLQAIWNLKEKRLAAEFFFNTTNKKLIGPHRIRWLKTYDAIKHILSIDESRLEQVCNGLEIAALTDDDYIFLKEYLKCIEPVAEALNHLSANRYSFGIYLPTLVTLRFKLNAIEKLNGTEGEMIYCYPLAVAIQNGFENRFADLMDIFKPKSIPLWIAMASNPQFKLECIGMRRVPEHIFNRVSTMLYNAGKQIIDTETKEINRNNTEVEDQDQVDANGTGFLIRYKVSRSLAESCDQNAKLMEEIDKFLRSDTVQNISDGLRDSPTIRRIYMKYNCIRTSEAICERMFSYAGMIFTDKRRCLTASFFEDLLLLHMNDWI